MLCQSSLLRTVISFVYKDKLWFNENMSVIFCMEILEKKFFYSLSILKVLIELKLENFVMQLKRQSVEAWQNEKHCSKTRTLSQDKKGPVKLIKGVKIAHSFLQFVSDQFHIIILSLPLLKMEK